MRVMDRARIPKRYEHCDFESYVTDLTDGKTWTAQHAQSLKQAKLLTQGFIRDYPGSSEKRIVVHRTFRRWKNASWCCGAERTDSARARGIVLRLPGTAEGNSGELQPGERIHGNEKFSNRFAPWRFLYWMILARASRQTGCATS